MSQWIFLWIWKIYYFSLKESYELWGWQHHRYERVYGGNSLASGHLVKSSFSRVSSTHLARTLFSSLYSSLNDSFAAGFPPSSSPTFLPLFLLYLLFFFPISFHLPRAVSLVHYFHAHSLLLQLKFDQSNSVPFYSLIIWTSVVLLVFLAYSCLLFPPFSNHSNWLT